MKICLWFKFAIREREKPPTFLYVDILLFLSILFNMLILLIFTENSKKKFYKFILSLINVLFLYLRRLIRFQATSNLILKQLQSRDNHSQVYQILGENFIYHIELINYYIRLKFGERALKIGCSRAVCKLSGLSLKISF